MFPQRHFTNYVVQSCILIVEYKLSPSFPQYDINFDDSGVRAAPYDLILASKSTHANCSDCLGVRYRADSCNHFECSTRLGADVGWEFVNTGSAASQEHVLRVIGDLGSLLLRATNFPKSARLLPYIETRIFESETIIKQDGLADTVEECELHFRARRWRHALECFRRLAAGSTGGCELFLRLARLELLIEKPAWNASLLQLARAVERRQGDKQGRECVAWAERTRGDIYFRLKDFGRAASHYQLALSYGILPPVLQAIVHSDCGAAMHMLGKPDNATTHYTDAVRLFPDLHTQHVLGTMGTAAYPSDPRVIIEASLKRLHREVSLRPMTSWQSQLHESASSKLGTLFAVRGADEVRQSPCSRPRQPAVSLSFFCRLRGQTIGTAEQVWGPSSIEKGVGGSEEAAIYLSRQLAALGYCVRVYGNPPVEEWGADEHGVVWLPFYAYRSELSPNAFISWRNFDAVWLGAGAQSRYLWVHDPLALASDQDYFVQPFLDALAGIFVLSKHSASQFPAWVQSKLILTSNGLAPHLVRDGPNHRCNLLYSSWPSSGLEVVLNVWPEIVLKAPCARLNVYYGFDMWWATAMYKDESWFIEWRRHMEELLKQEGVHYHGMVGHTSMAEAYAENGFYVYPTDTPETAPINLMKAQANGCIPITSRLPSSAIPETCGMFDLGPTPPADSNGGIRNNDIWLAHWIQSVIDAVNTPQEALQDHRRKMKAWSRARYNWTKVALGWHDVFHNLQN